MADRRVVIITGAGRGLGRAFAKAFADSGADVAVADLDADSAAAVAGEIGERAKGFPVDVSGEASVGNLVEAVRTWRGAPTVLVNNAAMFAGISLKPVIELGSQEWDAVA